MPAATLIDNVRALAQERGIAMRMQRGRDLVSRLLFGKSYSAAIAAERAGKLGVPELVGARTEELRAEYGAHVDRLADVAAWVISTQLFVSTEEPIMTASNAIATSAIPAPPALTTALLDAWRESTSAQDEHLQSIPLAKGNTHQGRHLRFIRSGSIWHAIDDVYMLDGSAYVTARLDGAVFQFIEDGDAQEDAHFFLTHVYRNGRWTLERSEHLLAEQRHLDLKYAELADAD